MQETNGHQVQKKLDRTVLYSPSYLVGIDFLVTCINGWLEEYHGSNKVAIATICGIGGIGKTTIAKVVYNQNIQRFEGCSFLADVRETIEERNGLVRLQKQLISDILKGKVSKIYNADDGVTKIKEAVCCRKVLVILDDVDDSEKITKIIGTQIPFHSGSIIIITSRRRYLLSVPFTRRLLNLESSSNCGDLYKVFEVKELAFDKSLQLFNWYAFGQRCPIESSMEYVRRVVKYCGGLPLALQVLGSSLSGKNINVWKSALEKLEAIPDTKIQKILRISYDSLEDDHDKNLFLDIACLFVGKDRDYTTIILDGCDLYTAVGIENLIGRSLLNVNEKNKLTMHQMIRDMGREIIRQESPNLGKRSRLWHKDAFDVIRQKIGTETIKCLAIDLLGLLKVKPANNSRNPFLISNEEDMETKAFAKMRRLKLLQLDYGKLKGDYRDFPKGLIWLRWHGFALEYFPTNLDTSRLVALDMRRSSLQVWKDTKCLPNLKILNLNHSHDLLKTPNFSGLCSLEKLMLKDCIKLVDIDQSIGELKTLKFLNLKDCKNLRKLPSTIGMLVSLEELILSGCSRFYNMPKELHSMKSLSVLSLDETAISESNSWLPWLPLKRRNELSLFWASLPCSLVKLSLENCRLSDDVMPNDLSSLSSLKSLNLSRNPIHNLPQSISSLTNLKELLLSSCKELQSLPKLPLTLSGLHMKIDQSANRRSSLSYLLSLKRCIIFGCEKLTKVEGVFELKPVENFDVEHIKSLFNVDSIEYNKVQIYSYLMDTKIVAAPQVFHECDVTSCFLPGNKVPISFEHCSKGSKISFSISSYEDPNEKIKWLNLCIVFSLANINQILEYLPCVMIFNHTKETKFGYYSGFLGIPEPNNNTLLWLIHWPIMGHTLEGSDSISCMVLSALDVREIGVSCKSRSNISSQQYSQVMAGHEDIPRNIELDIIESFFNLGYGGNVKVQICSLLMESNTIASPQVLYECGIISTFLPLHVILQCSHIPFVFGSKCSFTVPPNSSQKITSCLKSIIVLSIDCDETIDFTFWIKIVNETKGTKWTFCEQFIGIPEAKNTIYWLSSWKFMGELQGGDHVSFIVLPDFCVKDCVIHLLYESDNNVTCEFNRLECNSINDQYSQVWTRWSSCFFGLLKYHLFKYERALYRIQSLEKE